MLSNSVSKQFSVFPLFLPQWWPHTTRCLFWYTAQCRHSLSQQVCQAAKKKLHSFPVCLMSIDREGNNISTCIFLCLYGFPPPSGFDQRIGGMLIVPFGAVTEWFDYPGYQSFRVETGTHPSVLWHKIVSCRVMCLFLPEECAGEFLQLLLLLTKHFPACQC